MTFLLPGSRPTFPSPTILPQGKTLAFAYTHAGWGGMQPGMGAPTAAGGSGTAFKASLHHFELGIHDLCLKEFLKVP